MNAPAEFYSALSEVIFSRFPKGDPIVTLARVDDLDAVRVSVLYMGVRHRLQHFLSPDQVSNFRFTKEMGETVAQEIIEKIYDGILESMSNGRSRG